MAAVEAIGRLPATTFLHETPDHLDVLAALLADAPGVVGPRIHDAHIAALCLANGVSEPWSADRDLTWFPRLRVVNPLVGARS
ncbi:MAG: hypothetical protein J0H73_02125 [Salana multivorans]|uniref:hypothetical protein n=1 Tax=Salana multivorans TaxID=120377 RepID=UPI001AC9689D|nr:hypothetical protein [Salana multivorans]MBN8881097.1 hypothetical protein [Salana multivorans]